MRKHQLEEAAEILKTDTPKAWTPLREGVEVRRTRSGLMARLTDRQKYRTLKARNGGGEGVA